ncbi:MAG: MbtH family NRPS accessory protein [Candidatus Tectomicrobia bacterium]|nr:MbtH family NRPS accessory protein [Candidatus Tectomicrobia bacterium]
MNWDETEDTTIYKVVMNHEEQYSIWPADREIPNGWGDVGKSGLKAECLEYIEEVWTDMRPLSLRKQMEEAARNPVPSDPVLPSTPEPSTASTGDDLVQRLSEGDHPVEVDLRPEKSAQALKDCIDRGYVHIKFTGTKGGTELGVRLDPNAIDLSQADFDQQTGSALLVGELTLNYVHVRCLANVDLKTLTGQGRLEPVEA